MAGELSVLPSFKLAEVTSSPSVHPDHSWQVLFPDGRIESNLSAPTQTASGFAEHRQAPRKEKSFEERAKRHVPHLAGVAARQEGPAVPHQKRAAVGHLDVTHVFGVVQDAAKVQGHGLDVEVWEVDLSPNSNLILLGVLEKLYFQGLLCYADIQVLSVRGVKSDGEVKFLPYPQLHRLPGDEEILISSVMKLIKFQGLMA